MNDSSAPKNADPAARTALELAALQTEIATARTQLAGLKDEVAAAESRLANSQAGLLVESNELLVIAALRAQTDAVTAAMALDAMAESAEHDPLTQLPNRLLLLDRCSHSIAGAQRHGTRLALLFLDLDGFKPINDTYGHATGDVLLKQVADRLSAVVRIADTVSRYGGDEFLILLTEVAQPSDAALIAGKLLAAFGEPFSVGGEQLCLTASIGIALYPEHGDDAAMLIERADAAMYVAKKQRQGTFAFHGVATAGEQDAP